MLHPLISEWYGGQVSGIFVFLTLLGGENFFFFLFKNTVCVYDMYTDMMSKFQCSQNHMCLILFLNLSYNFL